MALRAPPRGHLLQDGVRLPDAPRGGGRAARLLPLPPDDAAGHRVELRDAAAVVRGRRERGGPAPFAMALRAVLPRALAGESARAGSRAQLARFGPRAGPGGACRAGAGGGVLMSALVQQ